MTNKPVIKAPVGRPKFADSARIKRSIMVDDDDFNVIAQAGSGNKSEGLHLIIEFYKAHASQPMANILRNDGLMLSDSERKEAIEKVRNLPKVKKADR